MDTSNQAVYYSALASRDPRFDGVFFVGVTSTGIYCRPVCTAKKPKPENCRFFQSAAAAEKEAFRPCLRCRPELAPGHAPLDDARRIASRINHYIQAELLNDDASVEKMADSFELSARQIRRIVHQEFGVSPIELVLTRRLLLAKQLLTETQLSMTEVAFSSGFSSVRRFNDAFTRQYNMPPSRLRKEASIPEADSTGSTETLSLQLAYRPPYDWDAMISFLELHAIPGIEGVQDNAYLRTVSIDEHKGWIRLEHVPEKHAVRIIMPHGLTPVMSSILTRIRSVFDLNARPDVIGERLSQNSILADSVARYPGMRIPGAFDGFEIAVRTILGQQISLKAANTLAGRFVERFGDPIEIPHETLSHVFPSPQHMVGQSVDRIASLGIIERRARCILSIAEEIVENRMSLVPSADIETTLQQLVALPGIGPWTAQYITMRTLHWPDAFPKEDIALRRILGDVTAKQADLLSQAWRPWRSYASIYLWKMYVERQG